MAFWTLWHHQWISTRSSSKYTSWLGRVEHCHGSNSSSSSQFSQENKFAVAAISIRWVKSQNSLLTFKSLSRFISSFTFKWKLIHSKELSKNYLFLTLILSAPKLTSQCRSCSLHNQISKKLLVCCCFCFDSLVVDRIRVNLQLQFNFDLNLFEFLK